MHSARERSENCYARNIVLLLVVGFCIGIARELISIKFFVLATEKKIMSKVCQITGKKAITGNNVSHSKRRTKRKFNVNVSTRKFYWVEQDQWVRLTVSAAGLRIINKMGLDAAMKKAAKDGYLTEFKTL